MSLEILPDQSKMPDLTEIKMIPTWLSSFSLTLSYPIQRIFKREVSLGLHRLLVRYIYADF